MCSNLITVFWSEFKKIDDKFVTITDLVAQPTPCYVTVPVKPGAHLANHNLIPIHKNPNLIPMVMNRGHNPYPTTRPEYLNYQNQQQSREVINKSSPKNAKKNL